jgi:ATP-dependent Clp protease ATP-binding subunit ClpB
MTDGQGRTVDFKNTIIIMTSNVGSRWIQELGPSRREEMEERVFEALRAGFNPEFLNRIDETIIFHNLTPDQIGEIVEIQISRLGQRLAESKISLELSDGAKSFLAEKGYDPVYGARPLKRAIQKYIENPLSMEILRGNVKEGSRLCAQAEGDTVVFTAI